MTTFDLEKIMDAVRLILVNYLNDKIDAINTEKDDDVKMKTVDTDDGLFLQQLNGKCSNFDPIVFYTCVDIATTGHGPMTAKTYIIDVLILVEDTGEQIEIGNLLFRYQRALEEIYEEHWTENSNGMKTIITSLVPRPMTLMNTSRLYRVVGIELSASIG